MFVAEGRTRGSPVVWPRYHWINCHSNSGQVVGELYQLAPASRALAGTASWWELRTGHAGWPSATISSSDQEEERL